MHRGKTLKDVDFIQINERVKKLQDFEEENSELLNQSSNNQRLQNGLIRISERDVKIIGRTLQKDTEFLCNLNIMDYSFFLVIEYIGCEKDQNPLFMSLSPEISRKE